MPKSGVERASCLTFSKAKYGQIADAPYDMWHAKSCASLISPEATINEAFNLIPFLIR